MMKAHLRVLLLSMIVAASPCLIPTFTQSKAQPAAPTLYSRLGGYDALAAVTDDFIGRLVQDKDLGRFFQGASDDSKKRIRQLIVDQLCSATGGPCLYIGRSIKASHAGLGISESEWEISVKHLVATLDKFKVAEKERADLLALLTTLKPDIVEKK